MKNLLKNLSLSILMAFVLGVVLLAMSTLITSVFADQYSDALGSAQQAFMIQSGLQGMEDQTKNYFKSTYLNPITDQYAWTKTFGAGIGGAYYIYKRRRIDYGISSQVGISFYQYGTGVIIHL